MPNLVLDSRVRAVLETPRLGCKPGTSRVVIDELKAADRPARDPFRYDPNRLLPRSARVRQVRVDRVVIEAPQPVAQLCAAAGLVYAKRHVIAELALCGAKAGC
jgi:hypothetical protein